MKAFYRRWLVAGSKPRALELQKSLLASCAALKDVIMVPAGGISTVYADGGVVLAF